MTDSAPGRQRLDSWKAIADYLKRDLATVRRWETGLGMPVHRVGGTGRSVFAYAQEIDEWLTTAKPAAFVPVPETVRGSRSIAAAGGLMLVLAAAVAVPIAGLVDPRPAPSAADLAIEVTSAGAIARDSAGMEQWRYAFPASHYTHVPRDSVLVTRGRNPGVYVATSYRGRQPEDRVESGALALLDIRGRLTRSFSFDDEVRFRGRTFSAPWAVTSFAVDETGAAHQVAVAAHHYEWDPGLVTLLDSHWRRRGTFVHAGWIEVVRWVAPARLLIGGFSNAHDGGMLAVLDSGALDGQGPEPAGSPHHCDSCGSGKPLRMVIMPRTEINRLTGSPFNRVHVQIHGDGVSARTIEVPSALGDADVHYEFTPSLEPISARFSDRYWEIHRALETDGKISHTRAQCEDRDGPRPVLEWTSATGWRTIAVR